MKKQQRNGYARIDRVKEQIMRELAQLVRTELKDPRAGFITINDVDVTRDRFFTNRIITSYHRISHTRIAF